MSDVRDKIKKVEIPESVTFLVLEDMDNIREQMLADLRKIGIKGVIHEAPCVKDALIACNKNPIDFIVSDWNLPDGTGMDFLTKIRASKKYANTPFVMCTTMDEVENICSAIELGANEYVVKPWEYDDLKDKILSTYAKTIGK